MAKKTEEKKPIEEIIKELERQYGVGAVMHGDQIEKYDDVVSTGSISLDTATGIGGIPVGASGKVVEIFGWESTGKSTVVQTIIGNYQKKGLKKCLYIDGENSIDEKYSKALGINLKDLYVIQLDESAGEGAYNKAEKMVESGEIGLVVYDSYNALQPKKVVDGEVGDSNMGLHARMLGQAVMKANAMCTKYGCTFIFIGQLREKIGVLFGSPEVCQGGNSLRFYAHMRMRIARSTTKDNTSMEGDVKTGNKTTVNIIKNKLAPPFRTAEFNILYGIGIDRLTEVIDLANDLKIIKIFGKTTTYGETKYVTEEFPQLLQDNDVLYKEIENLVLEKLKEI